MNPYHKRRYVWLASIVGGLVLSGLLVLAGWNASWVAAETKAASVVVTPDQILGEPRQLLFRAVTVDGEIGRMAGDHMFSLRSPLVRPGLLIILADGTIQTGMPLHKGQAVEVEGTVRILSPEEVRALAPALNKWSQVDLLIGYADHPYILATAVRPR